MHEPIFQTRCPQFASLFSSPLMPQFKEKYLSSNLYPRLQWHSIIEKENHLREVLERQAAFSPFLCTLTLSCELMMCSLCLNVCFAGLALIDAGEAMRELGEVKDALDMEVKQNFIDPLQNLHDKDLKEIQVWLHSLHSASGDSDIWLQFLDEVTSVFLTQ